MWHSNMMNNTAIYVEGLGKLYNIGRTQPKYVTLRDSVTSAVTAPFRKMGKLFRGHATAASELDETIWALKDISFEVKKGEVVGIIGSNGAGKSTLLKILSRITEPTHGFAEIHGRVGSLLEVGTGFHQELTGRENIYLNGAILGMKKYDIRKKFDEIVAFSEVDKFIDTPVKHYSSGMYLRLAFAVAAHLEPEILLVDEVLAVGDAKFQQKCLNKMQDVGQEGRTVFLVSHNMMAITRLCERAILIEGGTIQLDGPSQQVVSAYLGYSFDKAAERIWPAATAQGGDIARLLALRVLSEDGQITNTVTVRQSVVIEVEYEVLKQGYRLLPNFQFRNEHGTLVFSSHDIDPEWTSQSRTPGRYVSSVRIPGNLLTSGTILVSTGLGATDPDIFQFHVPDAVAFNVVESYEGKTARGDYKGRIEGAVRPLLKWSTRLHAKSNSSSAA
jgi:lipopolysaccharide transport system ATP-binding protein